MGRSQRHMVVIQGTDVTGKGLSEKQPASPYVIQYANSQAFSVPIGTSGGPLKGSTMAGFPPTLIPPPSGTMDTELRADIEPSAFTDPGQFNLSGNPRYESLPAPEDSGGISPAPPDPAPGEEPVLNSINPSSARLGSADVTMNVNGNRFTDSSVIYFNGGAETTNYISSSQLSTVVKPSTASVEGSFPVWVQQGSYQTTEKSFTFLPPNTELGERPLPAGPFTINTITDHADGIAVELASGDVRVGDTVLIEATGNTSINGNYSVLSVEGSVAVVDNNYELLAPIEAKGRLTVIG